MADEYEGYRGASAVPHTQAVNDMEPIDLRGRVVAAEHRLHDHSQRLGVLEEWRVRSDLTDARKEEQFKAMGDKMTDQFNAMSSKTADVDQKVDKISGTLSRIMWLILTGLIVGFVTFVVNGGLKIPA